MCVRSRTPGCVAQFHQKTAKYKNVLKSCLSSVCVSEQNNSSCKHSYQYRSNVVSLWSCICKLSFEEGRDPPSNVFNEQIMFDWPAEFFKLMTCLSDGDWYSSWSFPGQPLSRCFLRWWLGDILLHAESAPNSGLAWFHRKFGDFNQSHQAINRGESSHSINLVCFFLL